MRLSIFIACFLINVRTNINEYANALIFFEQLGYDIGNSLDFDALS